MNDGGTNQANAGIGTVRVRSARHGIRTACGRKRRPGRALRGWAPSLLLAAVWLCTAGNANAQSTPTVTVASDGDIEEGENAVFTLTRTGDTAQALTVQIEVSEGYADGSDRRRRPRRLRDPVPATATFQAGAATATLSLPTNDRTIQYQDMAVTLEVRPGSGYAAGTPSSARVVVRENDPLTVQPTLVFHCETQSDGRLCRRRK